VRSRTFDVIAAIFSKHFRISLADEIGVEIVDVDTSEVPEGSTNQVFQVVESKNTQQGRPLSPSRFPSFSILPYFQVTGFMADARSLLKLVELS
jgi:hypothetical protein